MFWSEYIRKAGIDTSKLTIYATDIGALPAFLLALEKPDIASTIVVGDFAPFNRPRYMYESLQSLKEGPSADQARAQLNKNRDDILENAFRRGLPKEAQFEISREFKDDMSRGWNHGAITTADAFAHYYSHFTRDQDHFESQLDRLKTPVKVVWGESDLYIRKEMGVELAERIRAALAILPGIGHYPHLQNAKHAIDEVRASFRSAGARPSGVIPMNTNKLLVAAVLAAAIGAPIAGFLGDTKGQSMTSTGVRVPFLHGFPARPVGQPGGARFARARERMAEFANR